MRYSVGQRTVFSVSWPTERQLWLFTIVVYGLLDSSLTYCILQLGGVETKSVALWFLIQFGPLGLLLQKALIFVVFGIFAYGLTKMARVLDQPPGPYRSVIAVMIAARGLQIIAIHVENIAVLLG